jgi:hypothetical protein
MRVPPSLIVALVFLGFPPSFTEFSSSSMSSSVSFWSSNLRPPSPSDDTELFGSSEIVVFFSNALSLSLYEFLDSLSIYSSFIKFSLFNLN